MHECAAAERKAARVHAEQVPLVFSAIWTGSAKSTIFAVCREGTYEKAEEAIKLALARGFRVTTNTTLFDGADPQKVRNFFDDMMDLGVEAMMFSPGYTYDKAPTRNIS